MKNAILLAKNQEYVSQKCEKSYFSTKYRISAQNRICPRIVAVSDCDIIVGDVVNDKRMYLRKLHALRTRHLSARATSVS